MNIQWTKHLKRFWKGWGGSLFIAVVIATSFKSAIADWNIVPTGSMKPTIVEGDRIFVNKLAYDFKVPYTTWHVAAWGNPQRGDIVVFYSPADGKRLVKRVVGVPGDTVAMLDDRLILNGEGVGYAHLKDAAAPGADGAHLVLSEQLAGHGHPVMITPGRPALRSFRAMTVPEGTYFMMGDNRDNSADSRYFGFVERSRIVGQATSVVISLDSNDKYRPRWERFFTPLP